MIEEEYITFETAKLAKEKGFDGQCRLAFGLNGDDGLPFEKEILRPTQQVLARWLREKKKILVTPYISYRDIYDFDENYAGDEQVWNCSVVTTSQHTCLYDALSKDFTTYEEAMEAGLQKALKSI